LLEATSKVKKQAKRPAKILGKVDASDASKVKTSGTYPQMICRRGCEQSEQSLHQSLLVCSQLF
jgi:hypothetical protein